VTVVGASSSLEQEVIMIEAITAADKISFFILIGLFLFNFQCKLMSKLK
jgi:hypothetical protein